jgi:simple sugar transport system permease protein
MTSAKSKDTRRFRVVREDDTVTTQDQAAAQPPVAGAAIARKRPPKTRMDKLLGRPESGVVIAAVLVWVFFATFAPHFFSARVTANVLLAGASLGIIAVGVATLMIAGQFDLSVGSVYGLSAALVVLMVNHGVPGWAALPIIMVFGVALGTINGLLVTRLEIHSLIITLGALMFYRGVLLAITEGFPIRLKIPDPFMAMLDFEAFGIPGPFFWFIGFAAIFAYVLTRTRFGNWLFATGGSPEAARGMGVPANRVQITAFAVASMLACVAGYVSVARFSSVDALRGTGMELEVVLAVVVGGASLNGGYGSIIGAALGVLIIGMIQQGLILMGISVYWYQAGIGLLLIVAAIVNQYVRKRSIS